MDVTCDELGKAHEGVWGQEGSKTVTRGGWGQGGPVAKEDGSRFFLQRRVGVGRGVGGGNNECGHEVGVEKGEGGAALKEGDVTIPVSLGNT